MFYLLNTQLAFLLKMSHLVRWLLIGKNVSLQLQKRLTALRRKWIWENSPWLGVTVLMGEGPGEILSLVREWPECKGYGGISLDRLGMHPTPLHLGRTGRLPSGRDCGCLGDPAEEEQPPHSHTHNIHHTPQSHTISTTHHSHTQYPPHTTVTHTISTTHHSLTHNIHHTPQSHTQYPPHTTVSHTHNIHPTPHSHTHTHTPTHNILHRPHGHTNNIHHTPVTNTISTHTHTHTHTHNILHKPHGHTQYPPQSESGRPDSRKLNVALKLSEINL